MTPEFQTWLKDHVFTPTELESYALCPFRFYAYAFLKLKPDNFREIEMTPAETGHILHEVLYKLLVKYRDKCPPEASDQALILLEEEVASFTKDRPHLSQVLLDFQKKRMARTLLSFVEKHTQDMQAASTLKPYKFEWSFGEKSEPLTIPDGNGGFLKIRGRIDRIDVDEQQKRFLVMDYKTGSTKISGNQIRSGEALQLPLYIMAVQKLLLPDYEPIGGVYYHLSDMTQKDGLLHAERLPSFMELHPRSSSLIPAAQWNTTFETITSKIQSVVSEMKKTHFPSHDEPCEPYCPYQDICRIRSAASQSQGEWTPQPTS